ncbi:hypothetical protein SAMN05216267_104718 [Actinacidiphila rubida]|uniref:Uncharacterized protein n=1 Tax=Actinacidiphila rubida TaxID=310780 RepID=A0A1H8T1T3_9ACTN|nr:hypothetical protein SAMN05216267_104718 [Actinacidiphila rubida]
MTDQDSDLARLTDAFSRLGASDRQRLVLALDGLPRQVREAPSRSFTPLPNVGAASRITVRVVRLGGDS